MNAKNRTVALGAVFLMCMTAFAGMCIIGDESDATPTVTAGSYIEIWSAEGWESEKQLEGSEEIAAMMEELGC